MLLKIKKNTFYSNKIINEKDISIVGLNLSNLNKAVIPWTKSRHALQNRSSKYSLLNKTVFFIVGLTLKQSEIDVVFSSKINGLLQQTVDNKVFALGKVYCL